MKTYNKKQHKEYIDYLKSFDNEILNESISKYNSNILDFNDLETLALENECLSIRNYFKTFQIGNILKCD